MLLFDMHNWKPHFYVGKSNHFLPKALSSYTQNGECNCQYFLFFKHYVLKLFPFARYLNTFNNSLKGKRLVIVIV